MELEKQGNVDVHFAAQQITHHQFTTNNWIDTYRLLIFSHDISLQEVPIIFPFCLIIISLLL